MNTKSVRIIYPTLGIGLANDARILAMALRKLGVEVSVVPLSSGYPGSLGLRAAGRAARRISNRPAALYNAAAAVARQWRSDVSDLNIFLQRVFHTLTPSARHNVLIPNPEWLSEKWLWHLSVVDAVWCKSHHAVELLAQHSKRIEYLGFTSVDRGEGVDGDAPPAAGAGWLHIASAGVQKGTEAVLSAWGRHPEWPELTVLQHRNPPLGTSKANMRYLYGVVREERFQRLMTDSRFHLCPSEAEGFGHSIVEAMSCGALVVSTDAPPMNELVQHDRGVLVEAGSETRQRSGTRYPVTARAVEAVVEQVREMSPSEIEQRRLAARAWFDENARRFERRFKHLLDDL